MVSCDSFPNPTERFSDTFSTPDTAVNTFALVLLRLARFTSVPCPCGQITADIAILGREQTSRHDVTTKMRDFTADAQLTLGLPSVTESQNGFTFL